MLFKDIDCSFRVIVREKEVKRLRGLLEELRGRWYDKKAVDLVIADIKIGSFMKENIYDLTEIVRLDLDMAPYGFDSESTKILVDIVRSMVLKL